MIAIRHKKKEAPLELLEYFSGHVACVLEVDLEGHLGLCLGWVRLKYPRVLAQEQRPAMESSTSYCTKMKLQTFGASVPLPSCFSETRLGHVALCLNLFHPTVKQPGASASSTDSSPARCAVCFQLVPGASRHNRRQVVVIAARESAQGSFVTRPGPRPC